MPGHFTAGVSVGVNLLRDRQRRAKLTLQFDIENIANGIYSIAHGG